MTAIFSIIKCMESLVLRKHYVWECMDVCCLLILQSRDRQPDIKQRIMYIQRRYHCLLTFEDSMIQKAQSENNCQISNLEASSVF